MTQKTWMKRATQSKAVRQIKKKAKKINNTLNVAALWQEK